MKPLIKILCLATLIVFGLPSQSDAVPYVQPFTAPDHLTVEQRITKYATIYATPVAPLLQVAKCESGLNGKAYNPKDTDGLPKYGLFQFRDTTFYTWAKKVGIEKPNLWSTDQQAQVAAYMFSKLQSGQWGCKGSTLK